MRDGGQEVWHQKGVPDGTGVPRRVSRLAPSKSLIIYNCPKSIGENISLNTYFRCGEHGPSPTPREATGVEDLVEKLMRVRTENCLKTIYKKNCAKVMRDELNASKIVR